MIRRAVSTQGTPSRPSHLSTIASGSFSNKMFINSSTPQVVHYGPDVFALRHPGQKPQIFYRLRVGEATSHNDYAHNALMSSYQGNNMTNDDLTFIGMHDGIQESYEAQQLLNGYLSGSAGSPFARQEGPLLSQDMGVQMNNSFVNNTANRQMTDQNFVCPSTVMPDLSSLTMFPNSMSNNYGADSQPMSQPYNYGSFMPMPTPANMPMPSLSQNPPNQNIAYSGFNLDSNLNFPTNLFGSVGGMPEATSSSQYTSHTPAQFTPNAWPAEERNIAEEHNMMPSQNLPVSSGPPPPETIISQTPQSGVLDGNWTVGTPREKATGSSSRKIKILVKGRKRLPNSPLNPNRPMSKTTPIARSKQIKKQPKRKPPKPPALAQRSEQDQILAKKRQENMRNSPKPTFATRAEQNEYLIRKKDEGMTYREIRVRGGFIEAESTLRGRYRSLTKAKEDRVRQPQWENNDVRLLREGVQELSDPASTKIPWKAVSDYIDNHGGSYHFGNSTCRRKWDEICGGYDFQADDFEEDEE